MQKYLPILRARRERRLAKARAAASRARGATLSAGMTLSILLGGLILAAAFAYAEITRDLPSTQMLPRLLNPPDGFLLTPTRVYDRSGTRLLYVFAPKDEPRRYLPINPQNPQHIPEDMLNAILAAQDPNFWRHRGYTLEGINDPRQSPTLAQKLAADLLLYNEAPSLRRALRERLLAAQLTAQFGRAQILEWYLNSANFGRNAYGVEAAAQLYFGKPASALTLAESVILAAANAAPALNPLDAEQTAIQRGRELIYILNRLGMVSNERAALALIETPRIQPAPAAVLDVAPAFRNLVLNQLETEIPRQRIERGGLNIITSLNFDLQHSAQCLTETYAARLDGLAEPASPCNSAPLLPAFQMSNALKNSSASALILDPNNGQVLALIGETFEAQETPLMGAHAAGSALDAFIYLAAFTRGFSPASLLWDIPNESGAQNFDGVFHGPLRLRVALANDYQVPAQTLAAQLGAENIAKIESSFGVSSSQNALLELAGAFGVFAKQGSYLGREINGRFTPTSILRVETNGAPPLDWNIPQSKPIVTPALAYLMTRALSDTNIRADSALYDVNRPAAVKSGQTQDGKDAWVIGYTPAHVVAAWTGARGEGNNVTPRQTAALWNALLRAAAGDTPAEGWSAPQGISTLTVCDPSGLLPTRECPRLVSEVFISGNEPTQADNLYREFEINRETNLLATVFTPPEFIEKRVYLIIPEEARSWALSAGLPVPPSAYDAIQAPPLSPNVNIASPSLFSEATGKVKIIGTASGENFSYYRVQVGAGLNPKEWIQVGGDASAPVENGVLAEWDAQGLSGLYAVRLLVIRADQRVESAVIQITIK